MNHQLRYMYLNIGVFHILSQFITSDNKKHHTCASNFVKKLVKFSNLQNVRTGTVNRSAKGTSKTDRS